MAHKTASITFVSGHRYCDKSELYKKMILS